MLKLRDAMNSAVNRLNRHTPFHLVTIGMIHLDSVVDPCCRDWTVACRLAAESRFYETPAWICSRPTIRGFTYSHHGYCLSRVPLLLAHVLADCFAARNWRVVLAHSHCLGHYTNPRRTNGRCGDDGARRNCILVSWLQLRPRSCWGLLAYRH